MSRGNCTSYKAIYNTGTSYNICYFNVMFIKMARRLNPVIKK